MSDPEEHDVLDPAAGFVAPAVAEELPGLRLDWVGVEARDDASPAELVQHLANLSNRYRGGSVVAMRTKPIPSAYRSFFRQIGLDPDTTRIPSEEAAVTRLFYGRFPSGGLLADSLLIALVETGVPVWALDADHVAAGGLGIRAAHPGERLGEEPLEEGTLVVADTRRAHAVLFGTRDPHSAVTRRTRRMLLYAVAVPGIPNVHVGEALWLAVEGLRSGRR